MHMRGFAENGSNYSGGGGSSGGGGASASWGPPDDSGPEPVYYPPPTPSDPGTSWSWTDSTPVRSGSVPSNKLASPKSDHTILIAAIAGVTVLGLLGWYAHTKGLI